MWKYLVWSIMGLILALGLGACTAGTPEPNDFPPRPTDTVTPEVPTPVPPTATPVPQLPTGTPDPQAAPALAAMLEAVRKLEAEHAHDSYDARQAAFEQYTDTLVGKTIHAWDGWVAWIYADTQVGGKRRVQIYLEDPYGTLPTPVPAGGYADGPPVAVLPGLPDSLIDALQTGQQVHFSGTIRGAYAEDLSQGFRLELENVALDPTAVSTPLPGTPPAVGAPAVTFTPAPDSMGTPGADAMPAWAEIAARLEQQNSPDRDAYLAKFNGKQVVGWQGWVIDIVSGTVTISMDDPYNPAPLPSPSPIAFGDFSGPVYIQLALPSAVAVVPQVGQKIAFSGTVQQPDNSYARLLWITGGQWSLLEDRLAGISASADLSDVVMRLNRTICYGTCPDYTVTVYGNGVVVWEGQNFVQVKGARITTVSEGTVRQALQEFQKADFFALCDAYTEYMVTDAPSANTFLHLAGRSKLIRHYQGDQSAPARLDLLETRIDEILQTAQWIK